MDSMTITDAQYIADEGMNTGISATVNDVKMTVPLDPDNRHYDEIMRQVAAGDLTIADAD
tara:strand:+ start:384 stop:563 length:180 start_codon:yes stop_codon:yes gene_type:complete